MSIRKGSGCKWKRLDSSNNISNSSGCGIIMGNATAPELLESEVVVTLAEKVVTSEILEGYQQQY